MNQLQMYGFKHLLGGLPAIHRKALSLAKLKAGDSVLDIGCGIGRMLYRLYQTHGDTLAYYGVDVSEQAILKARELAKDLPIKFKIAYAHELPFTDNSIDFAFSSLVYHHLPPEEKPHAFRELSRVLKPGGGVLISDLGRPKGLWGNLMSAFYSHHSFARGNMEKIEEELAKNGFETVSNNLQFGFIEHLLARKPE